jgi:peptidoglycan/LPS O-acetylase OafA/YrhL
MSEKPDRIAELDVFRGVAAVWVMLFHFMVRWFEQPGPPVSPFGEYAVHLFFMISGFVIFMTLRNTKTGADFIVSRVSRLYPPYWAAVLITAAFMVVMPPFEKSAITLPQVAVNLTMLQQWFRVKEVDGVYWTLAIELAFYGWMFVFFKLRALDRIERIGGIWIFVTIIARAWERMQMTTPTTDPNIIPHIISRTLILEHAHLFIAGMVFYRIRMEGSSVGRSTLLGFALFAQYFIHGPLSTPFLGIFFIIFLLIAKRKLAWLAFRPLVFLGGISYSLYLVHQNIGYAVMRKLDGQIQGVQVSAAIAVSMLIAILLTYVIEKPSLRFLRRKWALRNKTE